MAIVNFVLRPFTRKESLLKAVMSVCMPELGRESVTFVEWELRK